jgi:hypothetical protein
MLTMILPYRRIDYQTDLSPDQISQCLTENVITGFSFYSRKPYYGSVTPYSFSVRKTSSNVKKQGISPSVDGTYRTSNGKVLVTLSICPHMVWIVALFLFGFPFVLFMTLAICEFFKTGELAILLNSLFPAMVLYGIFWIVFKRQSSSDIRFWEHTLQLREIRL